MLELNDIKIMNGFSIEIYVLTQGGTKEHSDQAFKLRNNNNNTDLDTPSYV